MRNAFEETYHDPPDSEGILLRDRLVCLYQQKRQHPTMTETDIRKQFDALLTIQSNRSSVQKIIHRLTVQQEGLIKALLLTKDGTNNYAEQELRLLATMRYTSSGSDTYKGMETSAMLASIVKTQLKKPSAQFFPDMKQQLVTGVKQLFWQYHHTAIIGQS